MKYIAIRFIKIYQYIFSPDKGILGGVLYTKNMCVFIPTCSDYAIGVFEKYGFFKGLFLSIKRIVRCNPFQKNHYDPVP